MLSEVEICDQQCMGRDIGSERDYKIIRHKQKFETTEFDLCGLHCNKLCSRCRDICRSILGDDHFPIGRIIRSYS